MKLTVRIIDSVAPGGKALALCDEAGTMLPMQVGCTVRTDCDDVGRISVDFIVDGKTIRFAD